MSDGLTEDDDDERTKIEIRFGAGGNTEGGREGHDQPYPGTKKQIAVYPDSDEDVPQETMEFGNQEQATTVVQRKARAKINNVRQNSKNIQTELSGAVKPMFED